MSYQDFLAAKLIRKQPSGFKPLWLPDCMFGFQKFLTEWAIETGRSAMLAAPGLGKTLMQLVVAQNIVRYVPKSKVLILAPLAVSRQTVKEGEKFGIEVHRTQDGTTKRGINITNYERATKYDPSQFAGIILDESGILKGISGKFRKLVTAFLHKVPYRLLCSATPAPNDFMELGTHSEALGNMTYGQMLGMFFTNDGETTQQWRLKGHAKRRFWQWVATWARAVRMPSDLGFSDDGFILPKLHVHQHILPSEHGSGLWPKLAVTLDEQRAEQIKSLRPRCEKVASLIPKDRPSIIWCNRNAEGDLLERLIPGAVQVAGCDSDEEKEERLMAFVDGQINTLVTKGKIAGFGLNLQRCADVFYFVTHSHEMYYQAIRRCYRFGQKNEVNYHLVSTEALRPVMDNMLRKERQSDEIFAGIIRSMNEVLQVSGNGQVGQTMKEIPWL